ncbi:PEGA domain-containing protein [Palaeococcus pacificus]|nr:PEGA domain-containing protein [Palaeococcus pacificus]
MFLTQTLTATGAPSKNSQTAALVIISMPEGATVSISNQSGVWYTPVNITLFPDVKGGEYKITISKEGYPTAIAIINLTPRDVKIIKVDLEGLRAAFGENATVEFNEAPYESIKGGHASSWVGCGGMSFSPLREPPMNVLKPSSGDRYFLLIPNNTPIQTPGCIVLTRIYFHGEDGYSIVSSFPYFSSYIPPMATIVVNSTPKDAKVYVFDHHISAEWFTPMTLRVPVIKEPVNNVTLYYPDFERRADGKVVQKVITRNISIISPFDTYRIKVAYGNYALETMIKPAPGETMTLNVEFETLRKAFEVVPMNGTLNIYTDPKNAALMIKDSSGEIVARGYAPMRLSLPPGEYTITASKYRAGANVARVYVASNTSKSVTLHLSQKQAVLKLNVFPANATVLVNGARRGEGIERLVLKAGDYVITFRAPGFLEHKERIILHPGDTKVLNVTLTPLPT